MGELNQPETWEQRYARMRERSEREDLLMFINACFAATGQTEYYSVGLHQTLAIDFLHRYILANYRRVYARCLVAGINHYNQARIVFNLLRAGAPANTADRTEEGMLIREILRRLPTNRVYSLFRRLYRERVNNRRTRAVIKAYLSERKEPAFDAVKYRNRLQQAAKHSHLHLSDELGQFLFRLRHAKRFSTPLFDSFLRAHYSKQAIFELPMTVAAGFAARQGIDQGEFLKRIEPQMTQAERQRVQASAANANVRVEVDLSRTPLTKLALYILSLPLNERRQRAVELHDALSQSAVAAARKFPLKLGRVATVLDGSRSTWGGAEKRRRPLGVAVAVDYLVRATSQASRAFWTPSLHDSSGDSVASEDEVARYPFLRQPCGQTDLATPLLRAIEWSAEQIILVSDGYENSPPGAVQQIVTAYRSSLAQSSPMTFIHANPVFDANHFSPHRLGPAIVTLGLRDAEDLGPALGFARFAAGDASQAELEEYLGQLVARLERQC